MGGITGSRRVLVWFWGTGGAGIRLTDRFATVLASLLTASHVSISCHHDNPLRAAAIARGHPVTAVTGAAGHGSKLALLAQALPRAMALWRHLRTHRPDLVLIPMNFAFAWPFALLPRFMGIPVSYMVHDVVPHPGDFAPRWQSGTQRRLIGLSHSLLAPSRYTAEELTRRFPQGPRILVLPLSALTPPRRTEARGTPGRPIRFLFLGRLIAYKGLGLLAGALRPLKGRADWCLTIAGHGPEEGDVRRAFAGWTQVDLSRLQHVPEDDIEALIATHDVMLCPYREASQSGVVPEAQADGMPCLVTPVGALPEQVVQGRAGWVAGEAEAASVAEAIVAVLEDRGDYPAKSAASLALTSTRDASSVLRTLLEGLGRGAGSPGR